MELTAQVNSLSPLPEIFVSRSAPDYPSNFPWPVTCFYLSEKSEAFYVFAFCKKISLFYLKTGRNALYYRKELRRGYYRSQLKYPNR